VNQVGGCPVSASSIRVLDTTAHLALFDPLTSTVTNDVAPSCPGGLACAATAGWSASPLSLALDRGGSVWLAACNGEIDRFDVDTSSCAATGLTAAAMGFDGVTMTFAPAAAADPDAGAVTSTDDLLVVAGGTGGLPPVASATSTVGVVLEPSMQFESLATLSGWPGLSGTPQGSVWAFFPPGAGGAVPSVAQLDLRTAAKVQAVMPAPETWATPPAAFVVFRGEGVMFTMQSGAATPATQVFRVSLADGTLVGTTVLPGRLVVAAAVSTCPAAP
jgi:hypothetical protein